MKGGGKKWQRIRAKNLWGRKVFALVAIRVMVKTASMVTRILTLGLGSVWSMAALARGSPGLGGRRSLRISWKGASHDS
jgi:hypothetical protein